MGLIPNNNLDILTKDRIEQIQKNKHEYKLLGSFMRTKGLRLFSYGIISSKLEELDIKYSNQVVVVPDLIGGLTWYDPEMQKVNVDSRNIHFEALNYRTAKNRVDKFLEGKIKDLCNLREPSKKEIKLF